jgi:hypothetical protein
MNMHIREYISIAASIVGQNIQVYMFTMRRKTGWGVNVYLYCPEKFYSVILVLSSVECLTY